MTGGPGAPPHDGASDAAADPSVTTVGALAPSLLQWLPADAAAIEVPVDQAAEKLFLLVEFAASQAGRDRTETITRAAIGDVEQALHAGVLDTAQAAAARVAACSRAMALARGESDLEAVWSWVVTALGGTGEPRSTFDTNGIAVLAARAVTESVGAQDILGYLAADVFYTDQHAGYFPELLDQVADGLIRVLLASAPSSQAACEGAAAALYWVRHVGGRAGDVDALARWCAQAAPAQRDADAAVQLFFAAGVALPAAARSAYFASLLEGLPEATSDGLRLQVHAAAVEHDAQQIADTLPALLPLIDAFHGDAGAHPRRERTLGIVAPLISTLCSAGDIATAVAILRRWFAIDDDSDPGPVLMLGHRAAGTHWAWPGGCCQATTTCDDQSLTTSMNMALGTALATNVPGSRPLLAPATGRPDRAHAARFAACASAALGLADCPELAARTTVQTLLVALPGLLLPYQSLMSAEVGTAPALWVSLRTPRPDRWVSRVLLFEGDTRLAPVETKLVRAVLERAGIGVEVLTGADVTAATFRAAYASDEWDVIWVACHGRQPPYQPAAAEIELRAGEFVTIDDLCDYSPAPDADARLLVLNCCDGAVTVSASGPRVRGLAAQAVGPAQSAIAHQWSVADGFAATFGTLLAAALVETQSAARAYNAALAAVREPWQAVAERLADAGCDDAAVSALAPGAGSYGDNILDWGAPALYR